MKGGSSINGLLKHGLWALLVIGAYFVGTTHQPRNGPTAAMPDDRAESKTRRPNPAHHDSAMGSASAPSRGSETLDWLDSFRGADRQISAARMEEAVAAVLLESDPVSSTLHFTLLLSELNPENAPAVLKALTDGGGSRRSSEYLALLAHTWGRLDGNAAVEAFATLRGRGSDSAKSAALAAWAGVDPAAAKQWLQQRLAANDPPSGQRDQGAWTHGLLTGLARTNVDGALQYLLTLSSAEQRSYVRVLTEEKLKEGVLEGAEWALQLPEEPMRTNALETVGMKFLRSDLDGASQWAASIASRPDAHEAVADVADALATRDPAEAVVWVASLPAGPSQDHAYEDLFENWTQSDPVAAGQSLNLLEPGSARDTAVQAFSETLVRQNPEDALVWAGTVTDSAKRADLQVQLARRWQKSSPTEAATWISENLPADLQARVLPPQP